MGELVLLERRDDGVAVVTLNNPKVNALSQALLAELHEVALGLTADPPGAVVITGGERLFAAGADISEFGGADADPGRPGGAASVDARARPSAGARHPLASGAAGGGVRAAAGPGRPSAADQPCRPCPLGAC